MLRMKENKNIINKLIDEEIQRHQLQKLNEELSSQDEDKIRNIVRSEVSAIFFDLFKKRRIWGA